MPSISNGFKVAWNAVALLAIVAGTIKCLNAPTIDISSLLNFVPGAAILGLYFILHIFERCEVTTLLCIGCIGASGYIFYLGYIQDNPDDKSTLFGFGGTLLGFALGLPVEKSKSDSSPPPASIP